MPIFGDGAAFTYAILPDDFRQANHKPTAEEAAKAKALINFLMQDRLFLALYRSNDPKARAAAMHIIRLTATPQQKTMMLAQAGSSAAFSTLILLCPAESYDRQRIRNPAERA